MSALNIAKKMDTINLDQTFQNTSKEIESICDPAKRREWDDHPRCQRNFVWDIPRQQKFIDSILRGLVIPQICYVQLNSDLGGIRRLLVDGQQRVKTIQRFYDNAFQTAKRFRNDSDKPVCPGQFYKDLDKQMKDRFDKYLINVVIIYGASENDIDRMYRRMQLGMPLSAAEKLYGHSGRAKEIADEISNHEFFSRFYTGDRKRKKQFQGSVKLLMIENKGGLGWINTTLPQQIETVIKDVRDEQELKKSIIKKLDIAKHVFDGMSFNDMNYITIIYQILMLLDVLGCNHALLQKGILTRFINEIIYDLEKDKGRYSSYNINTLRYQIEFYDRYSKEISELVKMGIKDQKRSADRIQRLELWKSQDYRCAQCGKHINQNEGDVHHVKRHADGGKTDVDNLILIHKDCHQQAHSLDV